MFAIQRGDELIRIPAATNINLQAQVANLQFPKDPYYPLNLVSVTVPPLRDRREDIPLLVDHFIQRLSALREKGIRGIAPRALRVLMDHDFPGNVRELENEIERLVVLAADVQRVGADLLSARLSRGSVAPDNGAPSCLPDAMVSLERNMIYEVLKRNQWNKTRAAQELRISRRNLIRKVQKYRLEPS